ncbi:hypothetical protein WH47_08217, partial [Habropoda laboriosa]
EDELVLLICLTKSFRFFVNTGNIVPLAAVARDFLSRPVFLFSATYGVVSACRVARIPPTRLCGTDVHFMRDEAAICEMPRIKGE